MTPADVIVVSVGLAAVAWINWYFFLAQGRGAEVAKEDSSWKRR